MKVHVHIRVGAWPLVPRLAEVLGAAAPENPYVTCPECASGRVKRLTKRDRIDRLSQVPWSALQRFLGGRLYHCSRCRLQFYDCRRQAHRSAAVSAEAVSLPAAVVALDAGVQLLPPR